MLCYSNVANNSECLCPKKYGDYEVRISPPSAQLYVLANPLDIEPNFNIIPDDPRFYAALTAEQSSDYSVASAIYRAILDEALIAEESFRSSCIDGVCRCELVSSR